MKLKNKKTSLLSLFSLLVVFAYAGPVEKGIEYYDAKMYDLSKAYLLQGINGGVSSAEAFYYLGDTYTMLNKLDSASYYFAKSKSVDPEYAMVLVGEGKLALKNNQLNAAVALFDQAIKKKKKDPAVYTAIAAAYVEFKHYDKAPAMYEKARSVKKNYPSSFVVEGDMLVQMAKPGDACQKYENAIYFDANHKEAYLKEARVYKHINTARAIEILDKLVSIDPNYIPAYVEYAEIYYATNFKKALEAYEKFIFEPGIPIKETEKYAAVLYFTQNYEKSLENVALALAVNPNNFVMKRIQIYNLYELQNYDKATELASQFFSAKGDKEEYIGQDYITYGRLLQKSKQDSLAIFYLAKAVELDTTKIELYKDISTAYEKMDEYDLAISYFKKYMNALETPNTSDYYMLGKVYYQAGTQMGIKGDTIAQMGYLQEADKMFEEVTVQNSDSHLGYQWRARSLASMDPELTQGLAKPLYEQTLEKLLLTEDSNGKTRDLTECYLYLGNFYYLNKDKTQALVYFGKALELNPTNKALEEAIDGIRKQ